MANTFTNINQTKVMSECIGALKLALTPLRVFSLGVSSDPAEKNDTVNVPLVTARSASTNATDYEDGNTTIASAQVSVNINLSASWHITAIQASKTGTDAFEKSAVECVYGVAYAAQLAMIELITAASFTNETIKASTAFDLDVVQDIRNTCLNTLKWRPNQKMSLVLDGGHFANLMKDPAVRDKSASGMDIAAAGSAGKVAGFDLYENGVIAAATVYGGSEDLRGFATLPQALAAAVRPPVILGQDGFVVNEYVTDPDDPQGVTLNYRTWIKPGSNTLWGCVEVLFGAVKVDGSALYRIAAE